MRERERNRETKRNRKGERQETVANAVVATVAVRSLSPTATAATSCDSACRKADRQESLWRQWRWRWLSESVSVRLHDGDIGCRRVDRQE